MSNADKPHGESDEPVTSVGRHPVIGCMRGTVKIADGVDLTAPVLDHWLRELPLPDANDRDAPDDPTEA